MRRMPLTIRIVHLYMMLGIALGIASGLILQNWFAGVWLIVHLALYLMILKRRRDYYMLIVAFFWFAFALGLVGMILTAIYQHGGYFTMLCLFAFAMGGIAFLISLKESKDWLRKRRSV